MAIEYEYSFYNFSKKNIINKIKKLKGKKKGTFLFRVQVFIHPLDKQGTYIRVRDEGHRITMTYKYKEPNSKFEDENEIIIDDFDTAVKILFGIGCKRKYYYEKIREIWTVKNTEIVFDTNPGVDDRMEIESTTKNELNEMIKYFEVEPMPLSDRFLELFGVSIPKEIDLTFKNVKKDMLKLIKKNKSQFIEIVEDQMKNYNKLMKKSKK